MTILGIPVVVTETTRGLHFEGSEWNGWIIKGDWAERFPHWIQKTDAGATLWCAYAPSAEAPIYLPSIVAAREVSDCINLAWQEFHAGKDPSVVTENEVGR